MKKSLLACFALLLFLVCTPPARADSPVWKVAKGDAHLFIGGTVHVLSQDDYPLPEAFEKAYQASSIIVFEADIQEMQTPKFQQSLVEQAGQGERGGEGGVAAEGHLAGGGEPAQLPLAIAAAVQEGGLRLAQAAGQALHPAGIGRLLQQHHRRAVALQRRRSKGFDQNRGQQVGHQRNSRVSGRRSRSISRRTARRSKCSGELSAPAAAPVTRLARLGIDWGPESEPRASRRPCPRSDTPGRAHTTRHASCKTRVHPLEGRA